MPVTKGRRGAYLQGDLDLDGQVPPVPTACGVERRRLEEEQRFDARRQVSRMASRLRRRQRRSHARARYWEELVLAQLGLATDEEERRAWTVYRRVRPLVRFWSSFRSGVPGLR